MKHTLVGALAFVAAAFAAPAFADGPATPTPAPSPSPAPSAGPSSFALEGGITNDSLSNNFAAWNAQYLTAMVSGPHEASAYATASSNGRFGATDSNYEAGVFIPTGTPTGTITLTDAFSPTHNFLPASNFVIGYDARAGGGYGYQASFNARSYDIPATSTTAGLSLTSDAETFGVDRYFGIDRFGLGISIAQLQDSSVPTATSFTGRWGIYTSTDTFNASATLGRDVEEASAGKVSVYAISGIDFDDLHWAAKNTAIHAGVGYYDLSGAYSRFEVRLGLRQRI